MSHGIAGSNGQAPPTRSNIMDPPHQGQDRFLIQFGTTRSNHIDIVYFRSLRLKNTSIRLKGLIVIWCQELSLLSNVGYDNNVINVRYLARVC